MLAQLICCRSSAKSFAHLVAWPSVQADQFANMNSGLNWMLVQPADDLKGSSVVLGAWSVLAVLAFQLF
jgi:hypothetical protein